MARTGAFDDGRGDPTANDAGADLDAVGPLTRARVAQTLLDLEYPLFQDANGDLGVLWSQAVFHVYLLGEDETVLQVRGSWHRRLALERLAEVLALLDTWNREHLGPKCYVRVLDDGFLSVVAESSTPLSMGVTDRQLMRLIERGVAQGLRIMRALEERYPDPVAQPPREMP